MIRESLVVDQTELTKKYRYDAAALSLPPAVVLVNRYGDEGDGAREDGRRTSLAALVSAGTGL